MYSGLLPRGLTDDQLSSDDEVDAESQDAESQDAQSSLKSESQDAQSSLKSESQDAQSSFKPLINVNVTPKSDISTDGSLPGISQEMWQKFKELQKKKDEIQTAVLPRGRKRRRRKHKKDNDHGSESLESNKEREHQADEEKHWDGLKQYFGINDRFQPPACSRPSPKSGLEERMENAIAEGDVGAAEEMSDSLATRELAVKIAEAADCRDFVQSKQEAEASRAAQNRKRQIPWGFEAKKRWETKSNMGYM